MKNEISKANLPPANDLVSIKNNRPVTSSLQVAQHFGKDHRHVLRDIKNLECSPGFKESNFGLSFYIREIESRGQHKYPLYYMTRDGFTFLAMGFTGKIAANFKEEYINAFNQMEQYIIGSTLNEKAAVLELKKHFDKMNTHLKSYVATLHSTTGLSAGMNDLPCTITIDENLSFAENLRRRVPTIRAGLQEGWAIAFNYVKLLNESEKLRATIRDHIGELQVKHNIYG